MARMVEVDEEQLLRDQKLRALFDKVYAHPESAALLEQAAKMVEPGIKTPRLDAKKAMTEPLSAIEKKMDDFIKAQNEANASSLHDQLDLYIGKVEIEHRNIESLTKQLEILRAKVVKERAQTEADRAHELTADPA